MNKMKESTPITTTLIQAKPFNKKKYNIVQAIYLVVACLFAFLLIKDVIQDKNDHISFYIIYLSVGTTLFVTYSDDKFKNGGKITMDLQTRVKLNDGNTIPVEALGVWRSADQTEQAVLDAFEVGYRHIDTAAYYQNEEQVGRAIQKSGLPREALFITTKVWNDDIRDGKTREALEESLQKLQLDYVDLYLLHWPVEHYDQAYQEMIELKKEGKIKSIGVCNFRKHHLIDLLKITDVVPAINQIEINPGIQDRETIQFCYDKGIALEAWAPLARGHYIENETLVAIAKNHQKTVAQVMLHWLIQQHIIVLPKSVHKDRMIENSQIFDFELSDDEMKQINALHNNERTGPDPDNFDF